jgi:hypothetical protein
MPCDGELRRRISSELEEAVMRECEVVCKGEVPRMVGGLSLVMMDVGDGVAMVNAVNFVGF